MVVMQLYLSKYISYSDNFLDSPLRESCFLNAVLLLSTRCAASLCSEIRVLVDLQSDASGIGNLLLLANNTGWAATHWPTGIPKIIHEACAMQKKRLGL